MKFTCSVYLFYLKYKKIDIIENLLPMADTKICTVYDYPAWYPGSRGRYYGATDNDPGTDWSRYTKMTRYTGHFLNS